MQFNKSLNFDIWQKIYIIVLIWNILVAICMQWGTSAQQDWWWIFLPVFASNALIYNDNLEQSKFHEEFITTIINGCVLFWNMRNIFLKRNNNVDGNKLTLSLTLVAEQISWGNNIDKLIFVLLWNVTTAHFPRKLNQLSVP